jgi:hypothetical protein
MDVFEAVESRPSCRAFLDKPVDPTIVRELIANAARAARPTFGGGFDGMDLWGRRALLSHA